MILYYVFFDKSGYQMTKRTLDEVLKFAKKRVGFGIYAISKKKYYEMKNEPYDTKESLEKAIKEYKAHGFKVYYNGGT